MCGAILVQVFKGLMSFSDVCATFYGAPPKPAMAADAMNFADMMKDVVNFRAAVQRNVECHVRFENGTFIRCEPTAAPATVATTNGGNA